MHRKVLIGVAIIFAPSAAWADTKAFDLKGFEGVSVSSGIDATVTVGPDFSILADGAPRDLERLKVEVRGDTLNIGRDWKRTRGMRNGKVKFTVTLPQLDLLDVSSGASIEAKGVRADTFTIDASSGGFMRVEGTCERIVVDVSSGGNVEAEELVCRTAVVDASSGGAAEVFASEEVSGDASSGGSVRISGSPPRVSKDTSSGGSVRVD